MGSLVMGSVRIVCNGDISLASIDCMSALDGNSAKQVCTRMITMNNFILEMLAAVTMDVNAHKKIVCYIADVQTSTDD